MANDLNKERVSSEYEKQRVSFIQDLRRFNANRGTPFDRIPEIGGHEVDLYHLYQRVTTLGGWQKVNNDQLWENFPEDFGLPKACTNSTQVLKNIYFRFLNLYEKVNFLGEDADSRKNDDEEGPARKKICLPIESIPLTYNYGQHKLSDEKRQQNNLSMEKVKHSPYLKVEMSLRSGLPNEVDMAVNMCILLSTEGRHVMKLEQTDHILPLLLGHVGIFDDDSDDLEYLYSNTWTKHSNRDFLRFWFESVKEKSVRPLITIRGLPYSQKELVGSEVLNVGRDLGILDEEGQRVTQLAMIIRNLSFEEMNQRILANSPLVFKFLMLCVHNTYGSLRQLALDALGNLACELVLGSVENSSTRMLLDLLYKSIFSDDRFHLVRGLEILSKILHTSSNKSILSVKLKDDVYEHLISLLSVQDIQLIVHTLEALYKLSKAGEPFTTKIAKVHKAVDILVSLITIEAQSFGPGSLVGIKVVEYVPPTNLTGDDVRRPTTVIQPINPDSVNIYQVPASSLTVGTPLPDGAATPAGGVVASTPQKPREPVTDIQATTTSWLNATYEQKKKSKVNQVELFSEYLQFCRRFGIKNALPSADFLHLVKVIFKQCEVISINRKNGDKDVFFDGMCKRPTQKPFAVTTISADKVGNPLSVNVSPKQAPSPVVDPLAHTPTLRQRLMEPPRMSLSQQLVHAGATSTSSTSTTGSQPSKGLNASQNPATTPVSAKAFLSKKLNRPIVVASPKSQLSKRTLVGPYSTSQNQSGGVHQQATLNNLQAAIPMTNSSRTNPEAVHSLGGSATLQNFPSLSHALKPDGSAGDSDSSCVKSLLAKKLCQGGLEQQIQGEGILSSDSPSTSRIPTPFSSCLPLPSLGQSVATVSVTTIGSTGATAVSSSQTQTAQQSHPVLQQSLFSRSSAHQHLPSSLSHSYAHPSSASHALNSSIHSPLNTEYPVNTIGAETNGIVNENQTISLNPSQNNTIQQTSNISQSCSVNVVNSSVSTNSSVNNHNNVNVQMVQNSANTFSVQQTNISASNHHITFVPQNSSVSTVQQNITSVPQNANIAVIPRNNGGSAVQQNVSVVPQQQMANVQIVPQSVHSNMSSVHSGQQCVPIQPAGSVQGNPVPLQHSSINQTNLAPKLQGALHQHQQQFSLSSSGQPQSSPLTSMAANHLVRTASGVLVANHQASGVASSSTGIANTAPTLALQGTAASQSISSPAVAALLTSSSQQQGSQMVISTPLLSGSSVVPRQQAPTTVVIQTPPGTIVMPSRQVMVQGNGSNAFGSIQQAPPGGTVSFVMPQLRQGSVTVQGLNIIQQQGAVNMVPSLALSGNNAQSQQNIIHSVQSQNVIQTGQPQQNIIQTITPQQNIVQCTQPQQTIIQGTQPQQTIIQGTQPQQTIIQGTQPQQAIIQGTQPQQTIIQGTQPQQTIIQGAQSQQTIIQGPQSQQTIIQGTQPQQTVMQGTQSQQPIIQGTQPQQTIMQGSQPQQNMIQGGHGQQNIIQTVQPQQAIIQAAQTSQNIIQHQNLIQTVQPQQNVLQAAPNQQNVIQTMQPQQNILQAVQQQQNLIQCKQSQQNLIHAVQQQVANSAQNILQPAQAQQNLVGSNPGGPRHILIAPNQTTVPMGVQISSLPGNFTPNATISINPQQQPQNYVIQPSSLSSSHPPIPQATSSSIESQQNRSEPNSIGLQQLQQQQQHTSNQLVLSVGGTSLPQGQCQNTSSQCNGSGHDINGYLGSPDSMCSDLPPSPMSSGMGSDKDIPIGKMSENESNTLVKLVEKSSKMNGFVHNVENGCHEPLKSDHQKEGVNQSVYTIHSSQGEMGVNRNNMVNGYCSNTVPAQNAAQSSGMVSQGTQMVNNGNKVRPGTQQAQVQQVVIRLPKKSPGVLPQQQIRPVGMTNVQQQIRPQARISTLPIQPTGSTNGPQVPAGRLTYNRENSVDSDASSDSAVSVGDTPGTTSGQQKITKSKLPEVTATPGKLPPRSRKKKIVAEPPGTVVNKHQTPVQITMEYMCEWANCRRRFPNARLVFLHVFRQHIPAIPESSCKWAACEKLVRKRWSLVSHVQDHHCSEMAMRTACQRRHASNKKPATGPPAPTPPPPQQPMIYPPDAAIQAIRRFSIKPPYPEFADQREGPVSKHIRLTAALILRNICHCSLLGRRLIKKHEEQLTYNTMNAVEASTALSNCLWDLLQYSEGQARTSPSTGVSIKPPGD